MQSEESFLDTLPKSSEESASFVPKEDRIWKRYSVLGGIALSLAIGMNSTSVQAACNHLQGSAYVDCIGPVIDRALKPIDSPKMRSLREACQRGDIRACNEEIGIRKGSIRSMDLVIDHLKRQR